MEPVLAWRTGNDVAEGARRNDGRARGVRRGAAGLVFRCALQGETDDDGSPGDAPGEDLVVIGARFECVAQVAFDVLFVGEDIDVDFVDDSDEC